MNHLAWNVGQLFAENYIQVTATLSNVDLEEVAPFDMKEACISAKVETKPNAPYKLLLYCNMSVELARNIVSGMSHGKVSSPEDVIIYIREYINIASGKAVSIINSSIGKSVRFLVPEVQGGLTEIDDADKYDSYATTYFRSTYGDMVLKIAYTIDENIMLAERV